MLLQKNQNPSLSSKISQSRTSGLPRWRQRKAKMAGGKQAFRADIVKDWLNLFRRGQVGEGGIERVDVERAYGQRKT